MVSKVLREGECEYVRVCPNCGYENEETATICVRYNQALPPAPPERFLSAPIPQEPLQLPTAQTQSDGLKTLQFFLGVGLGLIPVLTFFLGIGLLPRATNVGSSLLGVSFLLSFAAIIAVIVCLSIRKGRFAGYGFLAAVLVSPGVGFIGCLVINTNTNS